MTNRNEDLFGCGIESPTAKQTFADEHIGVTNLENAKISEKVAALQVVLTTYGKMWEVISGRPVLKEVIDKFKTKQKQLEEAANEILREQEKDRERKRRGLTLEEYEAMETENRSSLMF